ncbi:MAG TPA: hypothetical protein VGN15_13710 [Ktedonobacteraceae bacterium]|nr:hypothetical protein [Ktedonobacteraceae bacterium]
MEGRPRFFVASAIRLAIVIWLPAIRWHTFTASNHSHFPAKPRPAGVSAPPLIWSAGVLSTTLGRVQLLDLSG